MRHLLAALLLLALAAPAAEAAWPGTPGRIAYLERSDGFPLEVFTPRLGQGTTQVVHPSTFHVQEREGQPPTTAPGFPSAPAWSPDGTRLAFAAKIDDPGFGHGMTHTAIHVWDVRTGVTTRITTPPDGRIDPSPEPPDLGWVWADYSPAWSPDGRTIAFVRFLEAGEDEPIYPQRGGDLWTVPATGGAPVKRVDVGTEALLTGVSWGGDPAPGGQTRLVAMLAGTSVGMRLVEISTLTWSTSVIVGSPQAAMTQDFDVAPDGLSIDMVRVGSGYVRKVLDGAEQVLGNEGALVSGRSSPTGNGLLHVGMTEVPGYGTLGGMVERRALDPGGDVWPEDPKARWVNGLTDLGNGRWALGTPGRSLWDVQPQQLPIINIPGFAGSDVLCDGERVWPPPGALGNGPRLQAMRLGPDGKSDDGCPGAGPTADPDDPTGFVSEVMGAEIYAPQERWIDEIAPGDRGWRFSWDWRKEPSESLARLDALVTRALATDFAKAQGLDRVVLYGHSYGGLLMREYLESKPERVARVLTAGTPFWGAPKSFFFIGYGVENPLSGVKDLDTLLPNADAKAFATNSGGLHMLLPSDRYGGWLRPAAGFTDQAGVRAWLTGNVGANGPLIDRVRAWHQRFDGFKAPPSVQVQAVIGTGLLSIGGVDVSRPAEPDGERPVEILMADGDITVPVRSASQGPLGSHTPLGDPVHVQSVCRVPHMELGGHRTVTEPYTEFLLQGRTPRKTVGPCRAEGVTVQITTVTPPGRSAPAGAAPRAEGALTPEQAADRGRIQLIDAPGGDIAVIDDARPVQLAVGAPGQRVSLRVTRYDGEEAKGTVTYRDLSGDVALDTAGGVTKVTVDGVVVEPSTGGGEQPGGGQPPDTDPPAGGTTPPGTTPPGTAPPGTTPPTGTTGGSTRPRARAALKVKRATARRRGRTVVVTLRGTIAAAARGKVTARVRGVKGKGLTARATPRRGRFTLTLRVRPSGRLPKRLTVAVAYAGTATHAPARVTRTVRPR